MFRYISRLILILGITSIYLSNPHISIAQTFDPAAFVGQSVPYTPHEAFPYAVPVGYDWRNTSTLNGDNANISQSQGTNLWGVLYPSTGDTPPSNTRVEVKDCEYWLYTKSGVWRTVDGPLTPSGGQVYEAGFLDANTPPFDSRQEPDGGISYTAIPGFTTHFWNGNLNNPISITDFNEALVMCSTRLILANASGPDDRPQANYILQVGADWRYLDPAWGCPVDGGRTICTGLGTGHFIKVKNNWRRAVFTTLNQSTLSKLSNIPLSVFQLPDGTYPGGGGGTTPTNSPATPTPTTGGQCSNKSIGDANCDNKIDLVDYEVWRREFLKLAAIKNADFNTDTVVDLVDYESWRRNFVK